MFAIYQEPMMYKLKIDPDQKEEVEKLLREHGIDFILEKVDEHYLDAVRYLLPPHVTTIKQRIRGIGTPMNWKNAPEFFIDLFLEEAFPSQKYSPNDNRKRL